MQAIKRNMKKMFFTFIILTATLNFNGCSTEDVNINDEIKVSAETDITYGKGNANAKVIITEYSDYQCPFCSKFTMDVLPQLQNDYLETGKVKFVFKDFPIPNHRYAQMAAQSTYCAGEQNEEYFWKMHIKLFESQKNLTKDDILKYADEFGININPFKTCLDTEKYKNLVLRNRQDGLKAGVNVTPTFFINDSKIIGVQPYENLVKMIDTELRK